MSDRHEKWVPVSSGETIPAGQPYRVEYAEIGTDEAAADERVCRITHDHKPLNNETWFVDSTWQAEPEPKPDVPVTAASIERLKQAVRHWQRGTEPPDGDTVILAAVGLLNEVAYRRVEATAGDGR